MEVNLIQAAKDALKATFGFDQFRDGQLAVIEHLLNGHSAAAVFPTGGGKSLCYQIPALVLDGLTIVVSPLIALMKDQIDALAARGVLARRLDSSLTLEEYRQVMDEIRSGKLRLLYVAPERFNNERFRATVLAHKIALFAVDEAHCISEWGHNFRPDYLKLAQFVKACEAERVLALTATATSAVLKDICLAFDIAPQRAVNTGFYRANLHLKMSAVKDGTRDPLLLQLLSERAAGSTIVYVTLQKTAEHVADQLASAGFDAKHYHAGMTAAQRSQVQEWFIASTSGIVVATIAFGMGIDKSNIRYVYHYNLPKSLENYAQEIGRAGRDGSVALCQTLACREDIIPLQNFVYGDTPTAASIKSLVHYFFLDATQKEQFDVSLQALSRDCDMRILVLRTFLTRFELDGHLAGGTPFYADYRFKPILPLNDIAKHFGGERELFLNALFERAVKARSWYQLELDKIAAQLNQPRERIVSALDYLAERQMLEVKVAGVRNRYSLVSHPADLEQYVNQLSDAALARELREIERLQELIDWVCLDACQSSSLCARFDKPLGDNCGHCEWCNTQKAVVLQSPAPVLLSDQSLQASRKLQALHPQVLRSNIEVARLLCGLSSPAISRAKLQGDALFGCAERIPFQVVLGQLES